MTHVRAAGLIGLGVMGRALAENIIRNDFDLVVWDVDEAAIQSAAATSERCLPATSLKDLTSKLQAPRTVLVIVPAGEAVDATVTALADHLEPGDVIVDLGNSNFEDTPAVMPMPGRWCSRCCRPSAQNSRMNPVATGWAPGALVTTSKWCTTASSTATCRLSLKPTT